MLLQHGKCHGHRKNNVNVTQKIQILLLQQGIIEAVEELSIPLLL